MSVKGNGGIENGAAVKITIGAYVCAAAGEAYSEWRFTTVNH